MNGRSDAPVVNGSVLKAAVLEAFLNFTNSTPGVQVRQMFGFPCAFCRGQMFLYVYESQLVLRLNEPEKARLMTQHGATPFAPKGGRGLREYAVVPEQLLTDPRTLQAWMNRAHEYALSLPAKTPKPRSSHPRRRP